MDRAAVFQIKRNSLIEISITSDQLMKNPGLAAAADALIEAASLDLKAGSMTQKQLAKNLDSTKTLFDKNLNKVVQTMQSSNKNFDTKTNTLCQYVEIVKSGIASMKDEISAMKTLQEAEKKKARPERAIGLTDVNPFQYYNKESYSSKSVLN